MNYLEFLAFSASGGSMGGVGVHRGLRYTTVNRYTLRPAHPASSTQETSISPLLSASV